MKHACLAAAFAATWLASPSTAATFTTLGDRSVVIDGRIDPGDENRFVSALSTVRGAGPIEVYLRSPGGSIAAAVKIADVVRKSRLTTRIPYRATCASACVLVFAAGVNRVADAESTIAVHSAGMPGQADVGEQMVENGATLAVTTVMARVMSSYGAPPSVIGKMVSTPTEETAIITPAELEAWNVRITRFVPAPEGPRADPSVPPRSEPPMAPPYPPRTFWDASTAWSANVMRVIENFGPLPWEDKVAYLRDNGSGFVRQCKSRGCYLEATYTGRYATIALYLSDGSRGRPVRQTWCVSDPYAWVRACFEQGGGSWAMRFDGWEWRRV